MCGVWPVSWGGPECVEYGLLVWVDLSVWSMACSWGGPECVEYGLLVWVDLSVWSMAC